MPTPAIELQGSVNLAVRGTAISMKEEVAEVAAADGLANKREVLVVEVGEAAKMMADTQPKATSVDRTAVVEEDMEEVVVVVVMDNNHNNLEPTATDTIHKVRAAGTASKAKEMDSTSKLRVVAHTANNLRATIHTDHRVAMILNLVPE